MLARVFSNSKPVAVVEGLSNRNEALHGDRVVLRVVSAKEGQDEALRAKSEWKKKADDLSTDLPLAIVTSFMRAVPLENVNVKGLLRRIRGSFTESREGFLDLVPRKKVVRIYISFVMFCVFIIQYIFVLMAL